METFTGFKKETGLKPIIQNMLRPTLPEFGKIKIGGKGKTRKTLNGKEFPIPIKFDYFVITTLQRDETGNFIKDETLHKALSEKYGTELFTRIPIRLLYNDPSMNFPSRLVCYKGKSAVCSGDGSIANRVTETGMKQVPCPCDHADPAYGGELPCKMNGVLSCIIEGTEKLGGVYKFRTTSFNTIQSITSSLFWILAQTHGILAGIPLELVMTKKDGTNPKTGEPVKVNVVRIEFNGDISRLLSEAKEIRREQAAYDRDIKMIEAQAAEITENDFTEQISEPDEFYPEPAIIETDTIISEDGTVVDGATGEIIEEPINKDFEMTPVKQPKKTPVDKPVDKPGASPETVMDAAPDVKPAGKAPEKIDNVSPQAVIDDMF